MPDATEMIPIMKPWIGEQEAEAARRPILSGWVTQGPEVAAFEQEFATSVGAQYACAVSSCTTALHLALLAAGIQPGDEVITVSHSFIATASAIRYCGATPVFVDINPITFNIDPALVERAISPRTRAILCVHQMGMPCDLAAIVEIASRHSLLVIEDAACAIGSEVLWNGRWERIGKPHGDIACFSFHPRKLITTGDGGMLTTANPEFDRKFRILRQHSMTLSDTVRHIAEKVMFETYPEIGFNYRMTDIQAAVGREQLKRLNEIITRRRLLSKRYQELLAGISGLQLPEEPPFAKSNWQSYCVRLEEGLDQREVMQFMLGHKVATRRGIMCAHREPAYAGTANWRCTCGNCDLQNCRCLAQSERAQDQTIILPLFHEILAQHHHRVVDVLRSAVQAQRSKSQAMRRASPGQVTSLSGNSDK